MSTDIKNRKKRNKKQVFLTVIAVIVIGFLTINIIPRPKYSGNNPWIIEEGGRPMVIVHAGAAELYPANTILAFENVTKLDIDVLECDLTLTNDSILITHHDLTIDRKSNGTGNVRDFTYAELLEYDFADSFVGINNETYIGHEKAKPETMENLFIKYPDMMFLIELKNKGEDGTTAASILIGLINTYEMQEKVIVASFDDEVNIKFRELSNETIMTSTPRGETTKFVILEKLRLDLFYWPNHAAFHVPISESLKGIEIHMDTKHFINEAHRHNMAVNFWTVNDKEVMRDLIELGVDGIITNRPDIMIELLNEMGY